MIFRGKRATIRAAELLGEAWAAHQAGDKDAVVGKLNEAHWCCGAQAVALLWAAMLGEIPSPDDPVWPDYVELLRGDLRRAEQPQRSEVRP